MTDINRVYHPSVRQQGVALVMSMAFLMILTLIGVTAMNSSALQEKMSGNVQDKNVAFQAAESALRIGEAYLQITPVTSLPPFDGTAAGHVPPAIAGDAPVWEDGAVIDWSNAECGAAGGSVCVTGVSGVKSQPRYAIENLGTVTGTSSSGGGSLVSGFAPPTSSSSNATMFRITALGTGGTNAASALVQGVFRKP